MPDVELLDLRNRRNRAEVVRREPMAGVHGELQLRRERCRLPKRRQGRRV